MLEATATLTGCIVVGGVQHAPVSRHVQQEAQEASGEVPAFTVKPVSAMPIGVRSMQSVRQWHSSR